MMIFLFGKKKEPEMPLPDAADLPPPPDFDLSKDLPNLSPDEAPQTQVPSDIEKTISSPSDLAEAPSFQQKKERPQYHIPEVQKDKALPAPDTAGPVFVRVKDYRKIIEDVGSFKNNIKEAEDIIGRLNELKNEEDRQFEAWRLKIEDVERKLLYADKILFES